jgi:hypothetical protein
MTCYYIKIAFWFVLAHRIKDLASWQFKRAHNLGTKFITVIQNGTYYNISIGTWPVSFVEKLVSELRQRPLNGRGTCECLNFDGGFHSAHKMLVINLLSPEFYI